MTFPEVLTIGKACLKKYAPRLKKHVRGKRPFSQSALVIQRKYDCSLFSVTNEKIERVIEDVLEKLIGVDNGFVVSEPRPDEPSIRRGIQEDTVSHNEVYLSFTYGYDIDQNTHRLWVACWYYPAP